MTVSISLARPQPWLSSPGWDCIWIISPALVSTAMALLLKDVAAQATALPLWAWVSLVLVIDVAHVYATLFRTYLNSNALANHRFLLTVIPVACWVVGTLLYSIDALYFWRVLAYLAVFHFIRQQYGFVCLYARQDIPAARKYSWLDHLIVYSATLYPLLYWHTKLPRNFTWFVDGDFVEGLPGVLSDVALIIYVLVAVAYIAKETYVSAKTAFFNVPKNLIILGTALSWWTGIILVNSDLTFTMTNVVTHGIPYMALIWLYHHHESSSPSAHCNISLVDTQRAEHELQALPLNATDPTPTRIAQCDHASGHSTGSGAASCETSSASKKQKTPKSLAPRVLLTCAPLFFVFLVLLAYIEEGLWDGLIWREHQTVFGLFDIVLPEIQDAGLLAILIPLLSLPQSTHYVLDGFIWRVKKRNSLWSA